MKTVLVMAAIVVGLFGCASGPAQKNRCDGRQLVGTWQGEREAGGKCAFLAWKMVRAADGQFSIVFLRQEPFANLGKRAGALVDG